MPAPRAPVPVVGGHHANPVAAQQAQIQPPAEIGQENPEEVPDQADPVTIGGTINEAFQIVHKLGSGKHSTTWLAQDQRSQKYRAIKVLVAGTDDQESKIIKFLLEAKETAKHNPRQSLIRPLLEEFTISGPGGELQCLVGSLAVTDLVGALDASGKRMFQLSAARAIAAQLIEVVAYLHSRGIVHGYIHPQNILLRGSQALDTLSIEQIYERFGHPEAHHGENESDPPVNDPKEVERVWLGIPSDELPDKGGSIYLAGFSNSIQPAITKRTECHVLATYCPPEFLLPLGVEVSFATDIWMLGCTIWRLFAQRSLFDSCFMEPDRVLAEIVDVLGMPPSKYWQAWTARHQYWSDNGTKEEVDGLRPFAWRVENFIQKPRKEEDMEDGAISSSELSAWSIMLKSMLQWKPEDRSKIEAVLKSKWMKDYGLNTLKDLGWRN